jgi:hypothetical protein
LLKMASLSIAVVPLEDKRDMYSLLRAFRGSGTLVAVQDGISSNVIQVGVQSDLRDGVDYAAAAGWKNSLRVHSGQGVGVFVATDLQRRYESAYIVLSSRLSDSRHCSVPSGSCVAS